MDGKKALPPNIQDNPTLNFYEVLNRALGSYRPNEILKTFWVRLYSWIKKQLEDKEMKQQDEQVRKKLRKHIERIDKKQSYWNNTYTSWLSRQSEILDLK